MARHAIFGRWLVEKHFLGSHFLEQLVTLGALNVLVCPAQRESSPLFVVEQGRFPFHAVVAIGTGRSFPLGELLSMDVLMAVLT